MRVLVLEGEPGASCEAALVLAEAGHSVARCHGRDEPSFPCRAVLGEGCPLEDGDVDAALVVRGEPSSAGPDRAAGEDGARCALRRHIPVVVAGEVRRSPLRSFATAVVEPGGDVVGAVAAAATAPIRRHADVARAAFAGVLEAHGLDPRLAEATVHRANGGLDVRLVATGSVPRAVMEMASVRVAGALRALDHHPRTIDVVATGA
jgi:hypothetical protein